MKRREFVEEVGIGAVGLASVRGAPASVPLINDPNNRVYFGPDPSLLPRDRVICGVQSHLVNDAMFKFVRALGSDD